MFARVSEVTAPVERLDDGVAQFRDSVVPAMRDMTGFVRAYLLVDRVGGKSLSISVWDSEESMRASEEAANQLRNQFAGNIGGQATASRYEIAVVEPAG